VPTGPYCQACWVHPDRQWRVGVRVPSGPRFGVDGAFEGYVRLPFTVGGPVAEEAAVRLAAAVELVRSGAGAGADAPRSFVA
ncbi:hypothetical protein I3W98_22080, partial [Streptomyces cavourensis]|nr:hypothetical protein [Streptomyces cavourensis]